MFFKIGALKNFTQVFSHEYCKTAFLLKTCGGCFFQFHKVAVQYWASADLLLNRNTM